MLKTIWLSDLHFSASELVIGHNPGVRLSAAIEFINQHHADSAFCIISGDLVNRGDTEDYEELQRQLTRLTIPYYPMAGNHDTRSRLKSALTLPDNTMPDFIQYAVKTDSGLILCLDTQKAGSDSGEFCTARLNWLKEQLETSMALPVFLFMHHPPMDLGLPMQDTERMLDGNRFLDIVEKFPAVKHLFIGHVHRPICGTIRGIPFATMRSVLYQAPAPQPEWGWDTFAPASEAPNIGILTIKNSDVTLHFTQFCDYALGVSDQPNRPSPP